MIRRALATFVSMLICVGWAAAPAAESRDAAADAERFVVTIDAPAPLDSLLRRQLRLTRETNGADAASLEQRARATEAEARTLLETEGYYRATVSARVTTNAHPPAMQLTVVPGPRTVVRSVDLRFSGAVTADPAVGRVDALKAAWLLPVGSPFRHDDWERAKQALSRALSFDRYPLARIVRSEAIVDPESASVRLEADVVSGPPFVFGPLSVSGLTHYPSTVIERLNPPSPGEPYSQRRLADFQTRVQRLVYFSSVVVTATPPDADNDTVPSDHGPREVPVRVELVEANRRRVDLGVGYSTNTGARTQAGYTDIDMFGLGWRWRNLLKVEQREQSLTTEFGFPRSADGYDHDIGVGLLHTDVQNFDTRSINLNAKRSKLDGRVERAWTLFATATVEQAAGEEASYKKAVVPGYSWRYRAFDDPANPHRGYDFTVQVGGGSKAALSDQNFVRTYARLGAIYDLTPRDSVIGRVEGGIVFARSREGIPLSLLYRAGGEQSIRGYGYQSVGVPEANAVGGGRYLAIAGAEYIRWITPEWGAAAFYDVGDAFDDRRGIDPRVGYGIGARWRSPAGPLNADIAYGQNVHRFRLHLSVGFVF